jgi:hypothetical protein
MTDHARSLSGPGSRTICIHALQSYLCIVHVLQSFLWGVFNGEKGQSACSRNIIHCVPCVRVTYMCVTEHTISTVHASCMYTVRLTPSLSILTPRALHPHRLPGGATSCEYMLDCRTKVQLMTDRRVVCIRELAGIARLYLQVNTRRVCIHGGQDASKSAHTAQVHERIAERSKWPMIWFLSPRNSTTIVARSAGTISVSVYQLSFRTPWPKITLCSSEQYVLSIGRHMLMSQGYLRWPTRGIGVQLLKISRYNVPQGSCYILPKNNQNDLKRT